jgi:hypothetical protein
MWRAKGANLLCRLQSWDLGFDLGGDLDLVIGLGRASLVYVDVQARCVFGVPSLGVIGSRIVVSFETIPA